MDQEEFERSPTSELDNLAHFNEPGYLPTMTLQQLYDTSYKEPPDPLLTAIAKLITPEMPEWSGSATELLKTLGSDIPSNALTKRLNVRSDRLLNDYKIRYRNTHQRTGSCIQLTLEAEPA